MLVAKIHSSYRVVVALCDSDLVGKKFEEDIRELDIRESFFKEKEMTQKDAASMLSSYAKEDATFFIVGKKAIDAAKDAGIVSEESIATIQNVPFTLILL